MVRLSDIHNVGMLESFEYLELVAKYLVALLALEYDLGSREIVRLEFVAHFVDLAETALAQHLHHLPPLVRIARAHALALIHVETRHNR